MAQYAETVAFTSQPTAEQTVGYAHLVPFTGYADNQLAESLTLGHVAGVHRPSALGLDIESGDLDWALVKGQLASRAGRLTGLTAVVRLGQEQIVPFASLR
ncbi:hypothetical protein Achl_4189 (plasmid) [Pseudarthrobacter chlorophenolicus A6]|uniref:Uncharacterized protein n=1 Tax=Pseudarthrobacter chlorophenolicus (strain ATCC 700700 / DSM 12829 / CIP 107037 / JCM 12360 / KCTC 9906 / NCIMB 13794 / A6) TaxID=452863 RepID=B8HI93_PSECP|nr:hypothetical protein Achl_4189 [Pseudarthrobacter chlorophenolicus A6]SDQ13967.1 hypothetical protein SAMN04489738_0248 [Pseudarthrobacter chlorophenolicus]